MYRQLVTQLKLSTDYVGKHKNLKHKDLIFCAFCLFRGKKFFSYQLVEDVVCKN
jgi:hypothetical protein